jgi:hypothetical protein
MVSRSLGLFPDCLSKMYICRLTMVILGHLSLKKLKKFGRMHPRPLSISIIITDYLLFLNASCERFCSKTTYIVRPES